MKRYSSLGLALVMAFSTPMTAFADGTGLAMPNCFKRNADLRALWERNDDFVRNFVRDRSEPIKRSGGDQNALCRELRAELEERRRTAATDCGDCRRAPEPRTAAVAEHREVTREVVRTAPIVEQSNGGGFGEFFSNPLVTGILGFGGGLLLGNLLFKDNGRQHGHHPMYPPMYGPPLRPPGLVAPPVLPYPGFSRPMPIGGGGGFGGFQPGFGGFQPGFGGFQPGFGGFQPGFGGYQPGFGGGGIPGMIGGGYQSPIGIGPGYNYYQPGMGGGYGFIQQPQYGLMNPNAPAILPFPGPGVMRTFSNTAR